MTQPFLFVIYSCKKNLEKANRVYSLIKGKLDFCKILVLYGDPDISEEYLVTEDKYLILKCGDFYEHLSDKSISLFRAVKKLLPDIKGVFKCDDDIIPNIVHLNSHSRYLLENNIAYSGRAFHHESYSSDFHFDKPIPEEFKVPVSIPACKSCSGPIYYLGINAINTFDNDVVNIFFEDIMVGHNLNRFGIYPDYNDLYADDFSKRGLISIHNFDGHIKFIYVRLHGRIGNWLFQVFSAYGIAKRSGRVLVIFGDDVEIPELFRGILSEGGVFYVNRSSLTISNYFTYDETDENDPGKNCFLYNENLVRDYASETDLLLFGYFQNEKYFMDYKPDIYRILENSDITNRLLKMYPALPNSYFIHVRRGDYVGHPLYKMDSDFYYRGAIFYILDKDPGAQFFIVSDDIEYCKTYDIFSLIKATFVESLGPIYTLYLMSLCSKGGICANSSFSWWGSYLNKSEDKTVIMPKQWINLSKPIDVYYENVVTL
jgi:hypothetical protein